jgi:prophage DNA circulation protein
MSTTIESLELEISTNSKSAVSGIDALTQSLTKLKSATQDGLGLGSISKQIKGIGSTASGINSSMISNVSGLAKAIQLFGGVKISSSISKQISQISTSLQTADFSSGKGKITELVDALSPLTNLAKTNLSSYVSNLKKLPETFAELNKINMASFTAKIQELATALKPLGDEMQKVANGFSAFPNKIQKLLNATNQIPSANKKAAVSFTDLYHQMKLSANIVVMFGKKIWSAVEKSMDYTENMNLFTVSMGEYATEAKAYAETVSDAMGIDPSEWVRAQGVFMTMATGFGVAGDRAATMSKNLTQLGYDLASFYNMDIGNAMDKLKSGLAGELEPLRAIGYDLSQAKLEATALELGISKSVSAMTQAEKAQLRYYAILTQVTVAQGDMARTLEDPANQVRVFRAQINMAAKEIGNMFIPALNAIIPYATAIAKTIGSIASTIASLFGYKDKGIEDTTSKVVENTDNVTNNLSDAKDEAKKLKSYMLGIDELNVINPNSSDTEDTSGMFDFELPDYSDKFMDGLVESKVNIIVEEMKEWLGLTEDIDSWSELLDTRFGHILTTVGLIGSGIALWKVADTFMKSIQLLQTILSTPSYAIAIGLTLTITGLVMSFNGMEDAITKGLDGFSFAEIIGGALLTTSTAALLGSAIVTWIGKVGSTKLVFALANLGMKLGLTTSGALGAGLFAGISAIILGIPMYFVGIYDACMDGIDWLNGLLIAAGATLAGAGIGFLIAGPVGAGIGALIGLAVGVITDLVIFIVQKWDEICAWFGTVADWFNVNVIQPVADFFKGLWKSVSGFFASLWDDIAAVWNSVATWFDENVIQPIVNFFSPIVEWISAFFEGCWIIIQAVWLIASTWFNENVIIPIIDFFKGLWLSVSTFFTDLWADIVAIWTVVSTWFNENVIVPVVDFFRGVWDSVSGFFSSLWGDIKTVWNSVSNWFNVTIIEPVKTAFKDACDAIKGFFSSLWLSIRQGVANAMNSVISGIESAINWVIRGINRLIKGFSNVVEWAADVIGVDWGGLATITEVSFSRITVPTYATGGFPEQGQMFVAREAGAEMVGNIGRRTAVANNDQIVSGIAGGVAEANEEQNALLREQNSLLRAILEKDSGVYLDGRNLTNSVEKYQRERGRVLISGGVI